MIPGVPGHAGNVSHPHQDYYSAIPSWLRSLATDRRDRDAVLREMATLYTRFRQRIKLEFTEAQYGGAH